METLIEFLNVLGVSLIGLALLLWMARNMFREFNKEYEIVKKDQVKE